MTVIKDAVASTLAKMGPGGAASDCDEVIAIILGTGTDGALPGRLESALGACAEHLHFPPAVWSVSWKTILVGSGE